jgi:hypothetical protein
MRKMNIEGIEKCYHECPYFGIEGAPGSVMMCNHPEAPDIYIISHPECDNGFPKLCPLIKNKRKAKGKIETSAICCAYDEMVAVGELKPNPRNPNTHPEHQVAKLAELIRHHGWRHPITVSNRSGLVVSGHCRLLAAKALKLRQVPVDYQDFASEAEEHAVLIADNAVQDLAEVDSALMDNLLKELEGFDYSLDLTALDSVRIDNYIAEQVTIFKREELRPFKKTHILLSFPPEVLAQISEHIEAIIKTEGVEYEQGSN